MVLEARENAEEVWYSLIWEEAKEASNVVNYNINPEITKDASSVVNANNDTTTGMANVIPWVNAPKLIASTSVIWGSNLNIVEISDYSSIDEWQPVVDRVLAWEFVVVHTKYTPRSTVTNWYLIPLATSPIIIRFQNIWVWTHWVRINCNMANWDWVITSINAADWTI